MDLKNLVSDEEANNIIKNIIVPNIVKDIKQLSSTPRTWRNISNFTQTLSHISAAVGIVFSFCSAAYGITDWGIYGGIASTLSVILNKFSDYAKKESKERTEELNIILTQFKISSVPDLTNVMDSDDGDIEKGITVRN
jgi:hypothetical protein